MMAGLRHAVERYVLAGSSALPSWPETAARLMREHRGIVAEMLARDPALARERIEDHINDYYTEIGAP